MSMQPARFKASPASRRMPMQWLGRYVHATPLQQTLQIPRQTQSDGHSKSDRYSTLYSPRPLLLILRRTLPVIVVCGWTACTCCKGASTLLILLARRAIVCIFTAGNRAIAGGGSQISGDLDTTNRALAAHQRPFLTLAVVLKGTN